MNETAWKTLAVTAIWLSVGYAAASGRLQDNWLAFCAAGVTSYYIWTYDREVSRAEQKLADEDPTIALQKWNELREKGIITQAEFDEKKSELL